MNVEVCRRSESWQSKHYFLSDEFILESIGITVIVEELYQRVNNEDVIAFLQAQKLSESQDEVS